MGRFGGITSPVLIDATSRRVLAESDDCTIAPGRLSCPVALGVRAVGDAAVRDVIVVIARWRRGHGCLKVNQIDLCPGFKGSHARSYQCFFSRARKWLGRSYVLARGIVAVW